MSRLLNFLLNIFGVYFFTLITLLTDNVFIKAFTILIVIIASIQLYEDYKKTTNK